MVSAQGRQRAGAGLGGHSPTLADKSEEHCRRRGHGSWANHKQGKQLRAEGMRGREGRGAVSSVHWSEEFRDSATGTWTADSPELMVPGHNEIRLMRRDRCVW